MVLCLERIAAFALAIVFLFALASVDSKDTVRQVAEYNYSEIEAEFLANFSDYKVFDTSELTAEILESRDCLIIERCIGKVLDAESGDGQVLNTDDGFYDYISYSRCAFPVSDGQIILTYLLYDADGHGVDDISVRYDFVLEEGIA